MALITCYECGSRISATAKVCPICGAPHEGNGISVESSETWSSFRDQLISSEILKNSHALSLIFLAVNQPPGFQIGQL